MSDYVVNYIVKHSEEDWELKQIIMPVEIKEDFEQAFRGQTLEEKAILLFLKQHTITKTEKTCAAL